MKEFDYLEKLEREGSMNQKLKILEEGMTSTLEAYFRMTFGDVVLGLAAKTIESAMSIKTPMRHKDIGERLEWWLKNKVISQSSLLAFSGDEEQRPQKNFDHFLQLFEELQNVSGTEMKEVLKLFFRDCKPVDAKWFVRCLMGNLSCGLSWVTINKVFKLKGLPLIETFDVSLCTPLNCDTDAAMEKDLIEILEKHKIVYEEIKYDGIRLILRNCNMLRKKKTEALSRNGKQIESCGFLINEFDRVFGDRKIELDGELIAKDFQTLMTQVHRKNDLSVTMPRQYMVFDILSLDGHDMTYLPYLERRELLKKVFQELDSEIIQMVKNKSTSKWEDVIELFHKTVKAGYEGIIIKVDGLYTRDRSVWWKMKPVLTADLEIVSLNTATDGRHAGKVSSFTVCDGSKTVFANVGSGITDEDIQKMNKVKDLATWLGRIIEVKYNMITNQNEKGERSLRHPVFLGFRFDKDTAEVL